MFDDFADQDETDESAADGINKLPPEGETYIPDVQEDLDINTN